MWGAAGAVRTLLSLLASTPLALLANGTDTAEAVGECVDGTLVIIYYAYIKYKRKPFNAVFDYYSKYVWIFW